MPKITTKDSETPITFLTLLEKYNGKIMSATSEELRSVRRNGLDNLFKSINAREVAYKN
jgi:hypothetical protein